MLSWRSLSRRNDMDEDRHSSRSGSATMPAKFTLAHNMEQTGAHQTSGSPGLLHFPHAILPRDKIRIAACPIPLIIV